MAKAVAAADTSKEDRTPPALAVDIRYRPGSVKNEQFREALARVKCVKEDRSWAGDANLWIGVYGSGETKPAEVTRALHDAGVKFRDPTMDVD